MRMLFCRIFLNPLKTVIFDVPSFILEQVRVRDLGKWFPFPIQDRSARCEVYRHHQFDINHSIYHRNRRSCRHRLAGELWRDWGERLSKVLPICGIIEDNRQMSWKCAADGEIWRNCLWLSRVCQGILNSKHYFLMLSMNEIKSFQGTKVILPMGGLMRKFIIV